MRQQTSTQILCARHMNWSTGYWMGLAKRWPKISPSHRPVVLSR